MGNPLRCHYRIIPEPQLYRRALHFSLFFIDRVTYAILKMKCCEGQLNVMHIVWVTHKNFCLSVKY